MANGNVTSIEHVEHVEDGCSSSLSLLKNIVASVVQHVQGQTTQEIDDWMKKPEFEDYARQLCSTLEKDMKTIPKKLGLLTYSPEQRQQTVVDEKCKHTKPLEEESEQLIDGLNQELCKVKNDNKGLETRIKSLEEDNKRLKKENEGLKKKKGKSSKAAVRILSQQQGGLFDQVYQEFLLMLNGRLTAKNVKLIECRDSHSETNHPLLIVCFSSTRLCTDVDVVIKDLKDSDGEIMLIIFHHADFHTNIPASNQLLTIPEFQRLSEITDVRFSSEKGIYPCNMNNNSLEKIANFILKHEVPIQKSGVFGYFK